MSEDRLDELLSKRQQSGLSEDEARELGDLMSTKPLRPDTAPGPPAAQDQWIKRGKPWERRWAIVGIVFAFPFLLTLPGWIGIDHYRKWQNYERGRPTGFITWGILWTAVISLYALAVLAVRIV